MARVEAAAESAGVRVTVLAAVLQAVALAQAWRIWRAYAASTQPGPLPGTLKKRGARSDP